MRFWELHMLGMIKWQTLLLGVALNSSFFELVFIFVTKENVGLRLHKSMTNKCLFIINI
jgi:hypothetical protein